MFVIRGRTRFWLVLVAVIVLGEGLRCQCKNEDGPSDIAGIVGRFLREISKVGHESRSDGHSRSRRGVSKACEQTIQAQSGYVQSPGFPSPYEPDLLCEWNLQVPAQKQILIRFVVLDVRGGASGMCTAGEDYLMIRDGTRSGSHLGIFCSPSSESRTPSPIVSNTNQVWIIFHSNRKDAGKGFLISFISVEALDYSHFVAQQMTFKPSTDSVDDVETTPTVSSQESRITVSPSTMVGRKFLPAEVAPDLTTINLPFESIAFGNPSRGPVHHANHDGFSVVTKTYSPPPANKLRRQTLADSSSPKPTKEKPENSDSQLMTGTSNLEISPEQLHSELLSEDQLQTVTERPSHILTQDILGVAHPTTERQTRTLEQQPPEMASKQSKSIESHETQISSEVSSSRTPRESFIYSTEVPAIPTEQTDQELYTITKEQSKITSYTAGPILTAGQQLDATEGSFLTDSNGKVDLHTEDLAETTVRFQISTTVVPPTFTEQLTSAFTEIEQPILTPNQPVVSPTLGEQELNTPDAQSLETLTEQQHGIVSHHQQAVTQAKSQTFTQTAEQTDLLTQHAITQTEQPAITLTEQQADDSITQLQWETLRLSSSEMTEFYTKQQKQLHMEDHTAQHTTVAQQVEAVTKQQQDTFTDHHPTERLTRKQLEMKTKQQIETLASEKLGTTGISDTAQMDAKQLASSQPPSALTHFQDITDEYRSVAIDGMSSILGEAVSQVFILLTNLSITDERNIMQTCKELNSTINETVAALMHISSLVQYLEYARSFLNESVPDDELGSGYMYQSMEVGPDDLSLLPFVFLDSLEDILSTFLSEAARLFNATLQASIQMEPYIPEVLCLKEHSQILLNALETDTNVTGSLGQVENILEDMLQKLLETDTSSSFITQPSSRPSPARYPLCYSVIYAETGIMASPNFPLPYPASSSCDWVIFASPFQQIALKFLYFDLDTSPDCKAAGDFLEIINPIGMSADSWMNTTYCSANPPSTVISAKNMILLKFVSDVDSEASGGFSLVYRMVHTDLAEDPENIDFPAELVAEAKSQIISRGLAVTSASRDFSSNLKTPSGELQSPNYPDAYPLGVHYLWNITVGSRGVIALNFTDFDLDSTLSEDNQCDERYAHVGVEDGVVKKHVFCGHEIPSPVVSSSNTLTITFVSGYGYGMGFHARYVMQKMVDPVAIPHVTTSEPVCGSNLHQPSGAIQSPNYPDDFETGVSCQWNITVDAGQIIVLNFTAFDLDSMPVDNWCNDRYAHVKIVDGFRGDGWTYCGQELPPVFISSSNTISVSFVSEYGYSGGFSALYRVYEKDKVSSTATPKVLISPMSTSGPFYQCGEHRNNPSGVIQSPRLHEDFERGVTCQWNITVPMGQIIILNFTNFDLDSVPIDNWCNEGYDHVKIADGNGGSSNMYIYCGQEIPPAFVSTTNSILVHFESAHGYSGGFRAHYVAVQASDTKGIMEPGLQATPHQFLPPPVTNKPSSYPCGGNLNGPSGVIQVPEYPSASWISVRCRWNLTVDAGWVVFLNFTTFDLDSIPVDGQCDERYAHVKVADGEISTYVFCGQEKPPVIVSYTRTVIIDYYSIYGIGQHFQVNYAARKADVGLIDPRFVTATPSKLTTPPTSKGLPTALPTDEEMLQCGGFLDMPTGELQSPHFLGEEQRSFSCQWNITVPDQWIILLNFTELDMDSMPMNGNLCDERYDHVSVVDGKGNDEGSRHLLCGRAIPGVFVSTTNTLTITFISHFGFGRGFSAHYSSVESESRFIATVPPRVAVSEPTTPSTSPLSVLPYDCGGNLNKPNGEIQSPEIPGDYTGSVTCVWNITVQADSTIALNFIVFKLDSTLMGNQCDTRYAHMSVIDGKNEAVGAKYIFCGRDPPEVFSSSSNTVIVGFVGSYGYGGEFYIYYSISSDQSETQQFGQLVTDEPPYHCGGNLNSPSGMIQSPNFASTMQSQSIICRWTIRVQVGWVIALNFTFFDLDSVSVESICDERYAHVKIIDGSDETSPAQIFCGQDFPPSFVTSTNAVVVIYIDWQGYSRGFRARYNIVPSRSIVTTKSVPALPTLASRLLTPVSRDQSVHVVCGSILTGVTGVFSSPGYPNMYPEDNFCSWIITTADNSRFIALKFLDFDVDNPMLQQDCSEQYSYVRISYHNEIGIEESRLLCGSQPPDTIAPASHQLTVDFYSNLGIGRGFRAAYEMFDLSRHGQWTDWPSFTQEPYDGATTQPLPLSSTETDGVPNVLAAPNGIITSPNYPAQFPQNSHDAWTIRPAQATFVTLAFEDIDFDVLTDDEGRCNTLYTHVVLTTYGLDSRRSDVVVCRNVISEDVISYGELKLEFKSSYGVGRGFKARYSSRIHGDDVGEDVVSPASSPAHAAASNASVAGMDQSGRDIRFLGEDGVTDQPNDGKRNFTRPGRDRVNVPVSQPQEPGIISASPTPRPDLEAGGSVTRELERTISEQISATLPGYTAQPKGTGMGSTDSGPADVLSSHRHRITTIVCVSVAVFLFVILILVTAVCIHKRRRRHASKSIDMGHTDRSYWQNYKSWAQNYSGGPGQSSRAATTGDEDEEAEEAEDMLKQERLV